MNAPLEPQSASANRLAPEIFRQRLLMEGYFGDAMTEDRLSAYMKGLCAHLNLRAYDQPVIYVPAEGMGRAENAGFDAFMPLIDSGVSAYVWSRQGFFSILLYTCKGFDADAAIAYTQDALKTDGPIDAKDF